jgi:hypothetical protein
LSPLTKPPANPAAGTAVEGSLTGCKALPEKPVIWSSSALTKDKPFGVANVPSTLPAANTALSGAPAPAPWKLPPSVIQLYNALAAPSPPCAKVKAPFTPFASRADVLALTLNIGKPSILELPTKVNS